MSRLFGLSPGLHLAILVALTIATVASGLALYRAGVSGAGSAAGAVLIAMVIGVINDLSSDVTLATDGFTLRWLGHERFVRFADIDEVRQVRRRWFRTTYVDVQLALSGGDSCSVSFDDDEQAKAFAHALEEATTVPAIGGHRQSAGAVV